MTSHNKEHSFWEGFWLIRAFSLRKISMKECSLQFIKNVHSVKELYAAKKKHLPYIHTYVQSKNSRLKRTSLYWRALGSLSWLRIWFFTISSVIPEKWSFNNSILIHESSHKTILEDQIINPSFFDDASLSALVFWFLFSLSK